jgi:hypothetical protein
MQNYLSYLTENWLCESIFAIEFVKKMGYSDSRDDYIYTFTTKENNLLITYKRDGNDTYESGIYDTKELTFEAIVEELITEKKIFNWEIDPSSNIWYDAAMWDIILYLKYPFEKRLLKGNEWSYFSKEQTSEMSPLFENKKYYLIHSDWFDSKKLGVLYNTIFGEFISKQPDDLKVHTPTYSDDDECYSNPFILSKEYTDEEKYGEEYIWEFLYKYDDMHYAYEYITSDYFYDAVNVVSNYEYCSTSVLQVKLGVSYGKACKTIDYMMDLNLVDGMNRKGGKPKVKLEEVKLFLKNRAKSI